MAARIISRSCMRDRARDRLRGAVWCAFVLLLVLCAIVGAQLFNQHGDAHVAARALPVRAAAAAHAQESRWRVAWRPGQRARAGRGWRLGLPWVLEGNFLL